MEAKEKENTLLSPLREIDISLTAATVYSSVPPVPLGTPHPRSVTLLLCLVFPVLSA